MKVEGNMQCVAFIYLPGRESRKLMSDHQKNFVSIPFINFRVEIMRSR